MATNTVVIGLSTIFDKTKTNIPNKVRKELNAKEGNQLVWLQDTVSKEIIIRANVAIQESKGRFV